MKTTAIIVAAGSGSRFGSEIPKQFIEIQGRPLIMHSIERFQAAPSIDSVIAVFAEEHLDRARSVIGSGAIRIVAGGDCRASSVQKGLAALDADIEIVAIHDGARPLVSVDEIERTVAKAKETGAACLVAPVTDTIKSIRGGEIAATVDRTKLRRALTPQAFRLDVLRAAFQEVADLALATDECYLVEKLGHPIAIVEGSPQNIKVTYPADLILAEALLRSTS